jgi:hypothetical protein
MRVATVESSASEIIYVSYNLVNGKKEDYIELMEELSLIIVLKSVKQKVVVIYDGTNSGFISWENVKVMIDYQEEKKDLFNDKVVGYAVVVPNLIGRMIYSVASKFVNREFRMVPFETVGQAQKWAQNIICGEGSGKVNGQNLWSMKK